MRTRISQALGYADRIPQPSLILNQCQILLSFGIQALLTIIISSVSLFLESITIKLEWEASQAAIANKVKFWNRNEATWNQLLTTTKTLLQTNSDVQAVTG
jgi:hypothetical protein